MTWKLRGRLAGLILLTMAFVSANASYSVSPAQAGQGDPVINYDQTDSAMNSAQAEARAHLATFFDLVMGEDGVARPDAGVKVAVPLSGGGVEVIWVTPFAERDDQFIGALANEPQAIEGKRAGDTITFSEADIRDWYFFGIDGKMYGSYTTRVMLADMSPTTADQIRDILADTPLPPNW